MFSPDGRFIAYIKAEESTYHVNVRPFPGPGGPWRVSSAEGGTYPRWSPMTSEILFLSKGKVMAARYRVVGDALQAETPQPWSPTGYVSPGGSPSSAPFDVHPDGKRLAVLAARPEADVVNDKVVFLFNFFDELRRIAPVTKK